MESLSLNICPCGSDKDYENCCQPIINGLRIAETAEKLMRSRYSAYVKFEIDYILKSTHISQKHLYSIEDIREWAKNSQWKKLEIISTKNGSSKEIIGEVEFKAYYIENNQDKIHHELSLFKKEDGIWYFVSGQNPKSILTQPITKKIGRNDPCSCGSGKKYKKCCG